MWIFRNRLSKRLGKSNVKYEIFDKKLYCLIPNLIPQLTKQDVNVEGARNICSTAPITLPKKMVLKEL